MLHPELERKLDLAQRVYLFEIRLDALPLARLPAFRPLSRFPSIRRDIAVLVAASAAHRGQAYDASRAFIDRLKASVPVWKHQVFTDGREEWVNSP